MTWHEPLSCTVCGTSEGTIRFGIAYWDDREPGMKYENVPRCVDRTVCRSRCIVGGLPWPASSSKEKEVPA